MTRSVEAAAHHLASEPAHLLVVESSSARAAPVVELLAAAGYRVGRVSTVQEALSALELARARPDLVVVLDAAGSGGASDPSLAARAAEAGLPTLGVIDDPGDPARVDRLCEFDDWVAAAALRSELPVRVDRLLRRERTGTGSPLDARFLPLIIHDLRTPLNVIGLSFRIVAPSMPRDDPELQEDLRHIEENFQIMVRMLNQLSDFHRLREMLTPLDPVAFDPRRFVSDLIAASNETAGTRKRETVLRIDDSCPPEVRLDQARVRQALQYALANATVAAREHGTVQVRLSGAADRWVTRIDVDQPPPATVSPAALSPVHFERLCGNESERRGMDLTIVARISALFGGEARLEVDPGVGTSLVLDWPATPRGPRAPRSQTDPS